jgi:flagellin-specific chaperone FliS
MDDASFEDGPTDRGASSTASAHRPHPDGGQLDDRAGRYDRPRGSEHDEVDEVDDDVADTRPEADPIRGLLFDATLRSLDRARRALAGGGSAVTAMGLSEIVRARRTLDELRTRARVQSLGSASGDGTVDTLVQLYEFCSDRLGHAARTKDPDLIPAVEDVLTELRDAFAESSVAGPPLS